MGIIVVWDLYWAPLFWETTTCRAQEFPVSIALGFVFHVDPVRHFKQKSTYLIQVPNETPHSLISKRAPRIISAGQSRNSLRGGGLPSLNTTQEKLLEVDWTKGHARHLLNPIKP